MVMQLMNAIETLEIGDAQEAGAVMVLPVVDEREVVVAGVDRDHQQARRTGGERERGGAQDQHGDNKEHEEGRGDERLRSHVMLRVTPPHHGRWAMSEPAM